MSDSHHFYHDSMRRQTGRSSNYRYREKKQNAQSDLHILKMNLLLVRGAYSFSKNMLKKATKARIAVEVLGSGSMGGEEKSSKSVTMGTIEGGMAMSSLFTTYLPDWNIFDLPFVFKDRADWATKVDGEMGQALAAQTTSMKIKVLNYFDGGFRVISNTKRPILGMKDFAGIKCRVGESTLMIDTHKALGDNPIPMSFSEIYTALQQGNH